MLLPPTRSISSNLAGPSSSATPRARRSTRLSGTTSWPSGARTRQTYSRSTSNEGCISALASSPSVVSSSRPVVLMSRRPIAIQRAPLSIGSDSNTVGRPSGSSRVVTSPSGLLYISTRAGSVSAVATKTLPSISILSPPVTLWPTVAVSPLIFTSPSAMRCSSARREPRPACARTLCRRSSSLGASAFSAPGRLRVSLRLFSSVIFLLLRRCLLREGGFGVVIGHRHGRRLDGVVLEGFFVQEFVLVRRAHSRRGFGIAIAGVFVVVVGLAEAFDVVVFALVGVEVVGIEVVGVGSIGFNTGFVPDAAGFDRRRVAHHVVELQLRFQLANVLEFRQRRQFVQALEAEVIEEGPGGAEQRRLARHVAVTDDADPLALFQRLDDVAADGHAADLFDLAAGNGLAVRPQARHPGVHVCLDLVAETGSEFDQFHAAFFAGIAQGFQRGFDAVVGRGLLLGKQRMQLCQRQRLVGREEGGFDYAGDEILIHGCSGALALSSVPRVR